MASMFVSSKNLTGQRWDHGFHAFQQNAFLERWSKKYSFEKLGDLIEQDSYGILTPGDVYSPDHPIRYLRVTDMRPNLEVDFNDVLHVPEEYYRHERARLRPNDILLAVKGASIAADKSVSFVSEVEQRTIVNGTVFRFQVKKPNNPYFVAVMLDSEIVKGQIRNLQISNNAVAYVDKPSIHALRIPLPPRLIQDQIAQVMQEAFAARQKKLGEAEKLLTDIQPMVLTRLGITGTSSIRPKRFLKSIKEIAGGRFDFEAVAATMADHFGSTEVTQLNEVAMQILERVLPVRDCPDDNVNYISLGNIAPNIGELVDFVPLKGSEVLSSATKFKRGDILFGRMRPYLNKVWIAEFDGICTGEAVVLRPNPAHVDTIFLQALLMSRLTLEQVVPYQSGTSLPRVTPSYIMQVKLPIPENMSLQREISLEIRNRRAQAKQLRAEAEQVVAEAKARVEKMILGEVEP